MTLSLKYHTLIDMNNPHCNNDLESLVIQYGPYSFILCCTHIPPWSSGLEHPEWLPLLNSLSKDDL